MASKKGEVTRSAGGMESLFKRPKTEYVDKEGEEVSVSPRPNDLIYIRNCKQCKFRIHGKAAKCIIEACTDVRVEFEECLISGTLEVIGSQEVTVSINPQDRLPTVSLERCKTVHLYYYELKAFGSVFTVDCADVMVHFQPPHVEEYKLDLPVDDKLNQFVSELRGSRMHIAKVIREGAGYATTVEKQRIAHMREEEMKRQVEAYLGRLIKITPKPAASRAQPKPVAQEATPKTAAVSTSNPVSEDKPSQQRTETKGADSTTIQADAKSNTSANDTGNADSATPQADPKENPLAAALQAKKKDLKPTETVERSLPVVGVERGSGGGVSRYNIEDEESKREYFDESKDLNKKIDRVAQWMKASKHVIVFTGAGVSTSAGIPDFRSGMNTVLETGPGVWELMANETGQREGSVIKPILQALPSLTHMSIVQLHKDGIVKFTVSQNVDGLHRRSGLGPSQLAELHGNTNLESCQKCHRQYLRDFETREAAHVFDHQTSRRCDDSSCKGCLMDSIINFGENLPERELEAAFEHAKKADMCIVLGSSLRVRPACKVPEVVQNSGGKVVICNLQKIPHFPTDNRTMQVFAKCDDFMSGLMERMGCAIPKFSLKRRARITTETNVEGGVKVTVTGLDRDEDVPYSFIKFVTMQQDGETYQALEEPLVLSLPSFSQTDVSVFLHFHGHYGEPPLPISCPLRDGSKIYCMNYDPMSRKWEVNEE